MVAFYNTRGGKIIFGVEDETRKPVGLEDAQKTEHGFTQIIRHYCKLDEEPEIEFVKYENKDFIVIHCPKGKDTPYFVRGEYTPRVRIGSSNMLANKEEIARLYRESSSKSQDIYPVENATLDDIDLDKIKEYFKESKLTVMLFLLTILIDKCVKAPMLTFYDVREILEVILPKKEITKEALIKIIENKHKARSAAKKSHHKRNTMKPP